MTRHKRIISAITALALMTGGVIILFGQDKTASIQSCPAINNQSDTLIVDNEASADTLGYEYYFNYRNNQYINKVSATLNGFPVAINFIDDNLGVLLSVYEVNYLLKNNVISTSDIKIKQGTEGDTLVGSTVLLHELVLGTITLTNIRAKIVGNDNVPFSLGLKVFSSYTNICVGENIVYMDKK